MLKFTIAAAVVVSEADAMIRAASTSALRQGVRRMSALHFLISDWFLHDRQSFCSYCSRLFVSKTGTGVPKSRGRTGTAAPESAGAQTESTAQKVAPTPAPKQSSGFGRKAAALGAAAGLGAGALLYGSGEDIDFNLKLPEGIGFDFHVKPREEPNSVTASKKIRGTDPAAMAHTDFHNPATVQIEGTISQV